MSRKNLENGTLQLSPKEIGLATSETYDGQKLNSVYDDDYDVISNTSNYVFFFSYYHSHEVGVHIL